MICRSCSAVDLESDLSNLLVQDVESRCSILGSNSSPCNECKELDNLDKFIARMEKKQFELKRNINRVHSPFIRMILSEIIAKISGLTIANFEQSWADFYPVLYFCRPSAATGGKLYLERRNLGHQ